MKSNHQFLTKVGGVLAMLLCTRLDGDELFERCKDLQKEKDDFAGKEESTMVGKDEFAKLVADLEARLKELESRLEKFELLASKEREANKELEEELIMYKKKAME